MTYFLIKPVYLQNRLNIAEYELQRKYDLFNTALSQAISVDKNTSPKTAPQAQQQKKTESLETSYSVTYKANSQLKGPNTPEVVLGAKNTRRLGGIGAKSEDMGNAEYSAGAEASLGSASIKIQRKEDTHPANISAGNANSDLMSRAKQATGQFLGQFYQGNAQSIDCGVEGKGFAGIKVKPKGPKTEFTATVSELTTEGKCAAKIEIRRKEVSLEAGGGVNGKVSAGVGVSLNSSTTKAGTIGPVPVYAKVPTANVEAINVKIKPALKQVNAASTNANFSNLRAAGQDANSDVAKKIQDLFRVQHSGQITLSVPNNLVVYGGTITAGESRATIRNAGNEGKTESKSNMLDRTLAGHYVAVDQCRWILLNFNADRHWNLIEYIALFQVREHTPCCIFDSP